MRVTNTQYETILMDKCHQRSTSRDPVRWRASLRTADVFPLVAFLPPKLFFGGREATTGNTSAVRRLLASGVFKI